MVYLRSFFVFIITSLASTICLALAGDTKNAVMPISFHLEQTAKISEEGSFTLSIANNSHFFSKNPIFSNEDIQMIKVFKSVDKDTLGMTCFLNPNGRRKLERISTQNVSSWLVCIINGKPVDFLYIDRQITDGQIVVWKNIEAADLDKMIEMKDALQKAG